MTNEEIEKILRDIGEYLAMQEVPFKPRAYEKVADSVSELGEELTETYERGGSKALREIPGVGASIAEHIEELLKTGRLKYYEQLKKATPVDLSTLTNVESLGPKKIKILYEKLHVRNLVDLERVANAGKIAKLPGFGGKSEEKILKGIEFLKRSSGRFLIVHAMSEIRAIERYLRSVKEVEQLEVAGSVRRRKETVGDADILVISNHPKVIMDHFTAMPGVVNVAAHGETRSAVKMKSGLNVDIRVVPRESYGAALNYFTGSKEHNVEMRKIAIRKGLKLNEYGLFALKEIRGRKDEVKVAGENEEGIYETLGLHYIEPELREMTGEIEASVAGKLPHLIGYGDLLGDLQTQTTWTDGSSSITEMARAAMDAGLEYIAITDHTKRLAMTGGLDVPRLILQGKEIDAINLKFKTKNFRILKGTECDILKDGSLDLPDEALKTLDVVGVSVHSLFNLPEPEQTARIVKAISNPHVDILFHPTGRRIGKRGPYPVDIDAVIRAAKETGTVLEVNASDRLDLKDEHIRKCVHVGVKLAINSDAHAIHEFTDLEFGIAQARRGWAEKKDIINAWPVEKMLGFLKR
ncbi:MAG: DNA polymerase/3'-5' exonuclease PolX [Patescibacteria group bacterium]